MKSIKRIIATLAIAVMVLASSLLVSADTTTDLSDMKVYAVTASGEKAEVKLNFNPTTYEYNITIKSTAAKIEIVATPADSTSTAVVEKDGVNTVMDTGINKTTVLVTSQAGATNRYTLNTTKVAAANDDTVTYGETKKADKSDSKKSKKGAKVKVGKKTFKISSFSKGDIPKGFVKTTAKYKGKKYDAIKGEIKDLTAFYLTGSAPEGFYIYDKDQDKFYKMNNLKVKSRMLTVVKPAKPDSILKNYAKDKIRILGKDVDVWILNEEEGLYFVYCMNWDGKTRLYTYDKEEEVLQRYLIDNDVNAKIDAANSAYDNIKKRHNQMVGKYNVFRYIILGMAIVIIFLVFLLLYLLFSKKEKKIKKDNPEVANAPKGDSEKLAKEEKKAAKLAAKLAAKEAKEAEKLAAKEAKAAEKAAKLAAKEAPAEFDPDDIDAPQDIEETPAEEIPAVNETPVEETPAEETPVVDENPVEEVADENLAPSVDVDEIPEVKMDDNVETEDDVILDVSDDAEADLPVEEIKVAESGVDDSEQIELDLDSISEQDDIQDTLKSMLDDDTEDDDDDFEFIDLN